MVPYQNPSIELFGLRIDEPVTAGTDIIVAGIGIMAWYKTRGNNVRHVNYYRYFFLLMAISTLLGALIGHAFYYRFDGDIRAKMPCWIVGIFGVGFAQFAVLYHTRHILGKAMFNRLAAVNIIEMLFVLVMVCVKQSFAIVEIHSAFGLVLMVCVFESINYSKTKSTLSRNMLIGVGLAAIAVICHVAKLAISNWFNHMDAGHVFMAVSLYIMYRGVYFEQQKPAVA